jgi:hypothetical protein
MELRTQHQPNPLPVLRPGNYRVIHLTAVSLFQSIKKSPSSNYPSGLIRTTVFQRSLAVQIKNIGNSMGYFFVSSLQTIHVLMLRLWYPQSTAKAQLLECRGRRAAQPDAGGRSGQGASAQVRRGQVHRTEGSI